MNCSEVKNLLSAYYDGELADELRASVLEHLDQCAECARELHGFQQLSRMAGTLGSPAPPERLWKRIETELDQELAAEQSPGRQTDSFTRRLVSAPRLVALAAIVLIAAGIGWFVLQSGSPPRHHDQIAASFGEYLSEFRRDPEAAQQFLLARYESHPIELEQAIEHVGYRPVIADGIPPEYKVESTVVMKMPGCTCVQALCKRSDGSALAVFEHQDEDPGWFRNHPSITVNCHGRQCGLVELDDSIAVSWKQENRSITLIGMRNLGEIDRMVAWLGKETALPQN